MKLNNVLARHLKEVEDKNAFLSAHDSMLEVIRNLLQEDLAATEKEIFDEKYELNWSTKRVDLLGQRRALKRILKSIT